MTSEPVSSGAIVSNRDLPDEAKSMDAATELNILRDAIWQWYLRLDGAEDRLRTLAGELVGEPTVPNGTESKDV